MKSNKVEMEMAAMKRFPNPRQQASSVPSIRQFERNQNQKPMVRSAPNLLGQQPPVKSSSSLPVRLHISNLPFRFREHNLVQLFNNFGPVLDAEIIYNDRGSKGFGFVTMASEKDAENALARLNHSSVDGRSISINPANPKKSAVVRLDVNRSGIHSNLLLAEERLKQAELEVKRLRQELCSQVGFRNVE